MSSEATGSASTTGRQRSLFMDVIQSHLTAPVSAKCYLEHTCVWISAQISLADNLGLITAEEVVALNVRNEARCQFALKQAAKLALLPAEAP